MNKQNYISNIDKHCKAVAEQFKGDGLEKYEINGNIVYLYFKSNFEKSMWKSEIVFKKNGQHFAYSSPFNENKTANFALEILELIKTA